MSPIEAATGLIMVTSVSRPLTERSVQIKALKFINKKSITIKSESNLLRVQNLKKKKKPSTLPVKNVQINIM